MSKEVKQFIAKLTAAGLHCAHNGGHIKVYRGQRLLLVLPSTPSDRRSLHNKRAQLKRMGVTI